MTNESELNGTKTDVPNQASIDKHFQEFLNANTLAETLSTFFTLSEQIGLKPFEDHHTVFKTVRDKVHFWKADQLWQLLDKKVARPEYDGAPCAERKILVIGAGPCGLRLAIECALLGAKVVVIEKREEFTRNNVLHMWPFLIADLRYLGAKTLYPQFCPGNIDHISIRKLQLILLKLAVILGVEVHHNIAFEDVIEPGDEETSDGGVIRRSWRALLNPADHAVSSYEFDVVIGADGRRNTLKGFERKRAGRALAIALTFNFVNYRTKKEAQVQEIGGICYYLRKNFFDEMAEKIGIRLENLVYFKDETHYFVVTAKKDSLLNKGVLKENKPTTRELLAQSNVDYEKLETFAREIAEFSTDIPKLDFEINHHNQQDIAMFDFTSAYAAIHPAYFREVNGHKLLLGLVGDSLLQPFWPQGTGGARGFLSCFDAAWMIRNWSIGDKSDLELLAEREELYLLLPESNPFSLEKNHSAFTIDPSTRYRRFGLAEKVTLMAVEHLYNPEQYVRDKENKQLASKHVPDLQEGINRTHEDTATEEENTEQLSLQYDVPLSKVTNSIDAAEVLEEERGNFELLEERREL